MPLKLDGYTAKRDYIQIKGGPKIWVDPIITGELLFEFQDVKDIEPENFKKEDYKKVLEVIKAILLNDSENKKEDVDLIDKMKLQDQLKIIQFVSDLIKGSFDSPDISKKKENSKI